MCHGAFADNIHGSVCSIEAVDTVNSDNTLLANVFRSAGKILEETYFFNTALSDLVQLVHDITLSTITESKVFLKFMNQIYKKLIEL